jgi:uncharacterized protein YdiU (UPF0061 family)
MYESFEQLNGDHSWRGACPDGYVDYMARIRPGGRVAYFNFALARQMQLIPANHAQRLTPELERKIIDAFALQIINEYDLSSGETIPAKHLKPNTYMATRYLQAQHKDKRGLHSGDGRAIWIGETKTSRGVTFDVSARGTGATRLSPGAQVAGVPVKTGDASYGYSCGRCDLDEMLNTVIMSEIFHRNGFPTERTLAVIDFPDGTAVGVRAAPNLLRPAHIFRYLKQGKHAETKAALDYFIERQVANGEWHLPPHLSRRERYRRVLTCIARSYGTLAAICEEEYIFNWLAWDGDNVLATGAILDYGSIRQFAAKHSKYRYDDIDRFSSSLVEQKFWARELVKVFAQAVDFVLSSRKRKLRSFRNHPSLAQFDLWFEREREFRMLWRLGFTPEQIEALRKRGRREINDLRRALSFFEEIKVARGMKRVPDGITHAPVFIIRNLLRELPAFYMDDCGGELGALMDANRFCRTMAASYASRRDLRMTPTRAGRAENFQKCYQRLIAAAGPYEATLAEIRERSAVINYEHRMTGNGIIDAVEKIMASREKLTRRQIQSSIDRFIESQILIPGEWKPITESDLTADDARTQLLREMQSQVEVCKETI